jgi:DNA-binding FadR family transcriptional regulator
MKTSPDAARRTGAEPPRRRPRRLALDLVDDLGDRIRDGRLRPGEKLPSEGRFMAEFGVSRTVVREALSKLQAAGMVHTRHGVGTFVVGAGHAPGFRIPAQQTETLRDVIAVLELRIGLETEAAALAAQRRTAQNLAVMREALDGFALALAEGRDAVDADFQFHAEIARATQNTHFAGLMATLGARIIPRARLGRADTLEEDQLSYLRRVNAEHEGLYDAIARQDADAARAAMRTHLTNSRERRRRAFAT